MILPKFIICFLFFLFMKRAVFMERDVGAAISISISVSDALGPSIFRRKMERTRPMRQEMDARVFFPARVGISAFAVYVVRVLFPICTLTRRADIYV